MELEIRLSDIESLSSFGSSLQPFWLHSEEQLKRLEASINEEICKIHKSAKFNGIKEKDIPSFIEEDKFQGNTRHESVVDGTGDKVISSCSYTAEVVPKNSDAKIGAVAVENVPPFGSLTDDVGNGSIGAAFPDESTPKIILEAGEDVDMDVDMEVEDASAGNTAIVDGSSTNEFVPTEQSVHPHPRAAYTDMMSGNLSMLPPSDEEWIPPPPPDNDQVHPPLPDEPPPPEPSYPPPSYAETGQPAPYPEHYNFSYADSNFQYYGHVVSEVSSNSLYAVPQAPIYYGGVPSTFAESAQLTVNPIVPVAYHEFQDGIVPPAPMGSTAHSSHLHGVSAPVIYDSTASDHVGSLNSGVTDCNSLPTGYDNGSMIAGSDSDTGMVPLDVPSTTSTIQAPATISTKRSVQELFADAVSCTASVPVASAVTKVQSKGKNVMGHINWL